MKKYIAMSALVLASAVTANAQSKKPHYYSERFGDNIFVSVAGGAQLCVNPDNKDYGYGDAITPQIQVSLGKWFNPVWGIRLQGAGVWSKLYSKYTLKNGSALSTQYEKISKDFVTARFDALYNLSNALCGYNPNRVFNLSAFAGPGLTFAKTFGKQDKINALINGNVGLQAAFNVSRYVDLFLEAEGEVSPSIFGKQGSAHTDGAVALTAGITYTFSGKNFVACGPDQDEIDALNAEINRARAAEAEALEAAKNAKGRVEYRTETKEVRVAGPCAFFFKIGSSKLTKEDQVNVGLMAKAMKENPDHKYKVAGYADEKTGSARFNQKLSEKRAQAICDALVAEGVNASQIEVVGCGGTPNMFGEAFLNRVVILE